jgi:hypothetical protein
MAMVETSVIGSLSFSKINPPNSLPSCSYTATMQTFDSTEPCLRKQRDFQ